MDVPIWFWLLFFVIISIMLALDLGVFNRTPHTVTLKEAALWSVTWVTLSLLFNLGIFLYAGGEPALQFLTGYLVEKSLAVDNWEFVNGREIPRPPVAQHPLPKGDALEDWTGPFRLSSHPNNYLVLFLYWLSPVMTVKWAAVGAVTTVYMVLGSMHEDARLTNAYGAAYTRYRERVPHLILFPIDRWRR